MEMRRSHKSQSRNVVQSSEPASYGASSRDTHSCEQDVYCSSNGIYGHLSSDTYDYPAGPSTSNYSTMEFKRNESITDTETTFESLGYSNIDRDEASYRAKNLRRNDITISGIEPVSVSWRISPEDSISLFKSHVLDGSLKPHNLSPKEDGNKEESLLDTTADLMNRIKDFPLDVSGCDMADMLLPPANGISTKERLSNDSSLLSGVPSISDISELLKSGLSHEELVNVLLDGGKSSHSPVNNSVSLSKSLDGTLAKRQHSNDSSLLSDVPNISDISKLLEAGLSQEEFVTMLLGTSHSQIVNNAETAGKRVTPSHTFKEPGISQWQTDNFQKPADKKANLTNTFDESFVPMSHSIIDRDEESILKKYHIGNDITIQGIESSNIPWELDTRDISLFRDNSMCSNIQNLKPISENDEGKDGRAGPSRIRIPVKHSPKVTSPNGGRVSPSRIPVRLSLQRTSPKRTCDKQTEDIREHAEKKVNPTNISDKPGTSQRQVDNFQNPTEEKVIPTNTFVPISPYIADHDEDNLSKTYYIGNDVTIQGTESSNISWQLNPSDISLFKDLSLSTNRSNLHRISEKDVQKD